MTLYVAAYYPLLALAALAGVYRSVRERNVGILDAQLAAAFVTAIMGSLDPGSSYNVLVPWVRSASLGARSSLAS